MLYLLVLELFLNKNFDSLKYPKDDSFTLTNHNGGQILI